MSDYQGLVTKWQKVQDEMPEYDTDLLLWSEAWGHIYVGYWRHSEEWIGRHRPESDESLPDTNPTHWTYFPAPPLAEVIARNVQPSPDDEELRLDGIMASTPSGALDVIAPTYGGISRSNWPARPVQQPATEPDATGRAIEHGGYLATAAENYLNERNRYEIAVAGYSDEETTEVADADSLADHHQALRVAIYEFRKRAALALRDVPQGAMPDLCGCGKPEGDPAHTGWKDRNWRLLGHHKYKPSALAARQVPVGPEGKK